MNNTLIFERLWGITNQLRQKLETRFELSLDPSTQSLQEYSSSDGNVKGTLQAFTGQEIDWLVHSHLRNLGQSQFNTMRLTVWLNSYIRVPHLAIELSVLPNALFYYIDYIPRTDLICDLEYLDRYYEPVNQTYLSLQANPDLSLFTSKNLYIRQFQSPISLCYTCSPTEDMLNLIETLAHEMLERWLLWIDEAEPVSEDARTALTERDLFMRRTSAECDPGNKFAAQILGQELTDKLVRSLWGGDRVQQ
ncbi:MAG: red chlorophyll catabolite reductase [Scytonema sp. PMC 1069.18]|nr:red chlorophyll catabolite reductase [Scytonema sp. PMC 1069.18]MEC4882157.1 red chlorophyll catabolite reductase [Scytonema sp. PMC 1070.18]